MIAIYNILHGKYDMDYSDILIFSTTTHTRGHMLKLFKHFSRTDTRKYFFARRVIETLSNLPPEVVSAESENRLIDCYPSN